MDNLSNNQTEASQPTVVFAKKNFFQTKKGISIAITALAVVIFSGIVFVLNFQGTAIFPKTNLTGQPIGITLLPENYGFRAGELTLDCPVESIFCSSQKLISLNAFDAVSYAAGSDSTVLNLKEVPSLENIAVLTNLQTSKKYFYESVVSSDGKSCYTIAYTLPADATFGDLLSIPGRSDATIATLGSEKILINGEESSVIIQVRNTPMDPGVPCSLIRKNPEFFKVFD